MMEERSWGDGKISINLCGDLKARVRRGTCVATCPAVLA